MTSNFWSGGRGPTDPIVNGRYQLPDPVTGEERSWTRASNFGHPIADQYGLTVHRHRQIVRGIREREDLQRLVSVLDPDDRTKVDEVISTALEAARTTEQANRGTAIHEALALADRGLAWPTWADLYVQGYRAELARHGLEPVRVEVTLVNRDRVVAGRADRVYRDCRGRHVVGDLKTTDHLGLAAGEIAVQVECYAGASHVLSDDGSWLPLDVDRDVAVVVHVDRETGTTSIYRVHMTLARYGANLATSVRQWHRMRPELLLPYVPPAPTRADHLAPCGPPTRTLTANASDPWVQGNESPMVGETRTEGGQLMQYTEAQGWVPIATPNTDDKSIVDAAPKDDSAQTEGPVLRTAASLLAPKTSKAQVQAYARSHGLTDLVHTKKVLVEMLGRAGKLAPATVAEHVDPEGAKARALNSVAQAEGAAYEAAVLERIGRAGSVSEMSDIHTRVVTDRGDQAWTEAMTSAARKRAVSLEPDVSRDTTQVLGRVAACRAQQEIAQLWEEITLGGSQPEAWPAEVTAAANRRLAEISATTPAPPTNPFSS